MPVVECPVAGCGHKTADTGDAAGAVLLKFHLNTAHSVSPATTHEPTPKLQLDRPRIKAGAGNDDWSHFIRDWQTYKDVCRLTETQCKKVLFECCDDGLKHLMYGQYTQEQQAAARR